jgi:hypothetical protein
MRLRTVTAAAFAVITLFAGTCRAEDTCNYFNGSIEGDSCGIVLFRAFAEGLKPESMEMVLDEEPDDSGRVRHMYLDLYGCDLGGVRIDRLEIEAVDVQFTPTCEWKESGPEIENMLAVYAQAVILEKDVNEAISDEAFGDGDEHWHDISLDFRENGVYVKGYYLATVIFRLDILIELEGSFGIVGGKQVWLEDYTMKVNRVDLPDFITERAIGNIQPIIDLEDFVFPLTLKTVIQETDKVTLQSRVLPRRIEGILYKYQADPADKE